VSVIVYADFSSPEDYAASRRVDALRAAGVPVDWRAVEAAPDLSRVAVPVSPAVKADLTVRVDRLRSMLLPGETLPATIPSLIPRTRATVSAYAEAYGADVPDDVRRVLFELYWRDGVDIGAPAALYGPLVGPMLRGRSDVDPVRDHGCAVAVTGDPVSTAAYRRIRAWRQEWQALGEPLLPVLLTDGAQLSGPDVFERLGKTLVAHGADPNPMLADPRRFPSLPVRPDPGWLSEIGGQWRNALHLPERVGQLELTR